MWQYRRPDQGMTLIEIMISVGIFSIILAGTFGIMATTQPAVLSTSVDIALQERAKNLVEQMVRELRTARQSPDLLMLAEPHPTDGTLFNSITFERIIEMSGEIDGVGGPARVDDPITYRLDPNPDDPEDDVDNNSNGVVDEKMLVREQSDKEVILSRCVDSDEAIDMGELWFSKSTPGLIRIRLTIFSSDPCKKNPDNPNRPVVYRASIETQAFVRTIE